MIIVKYHEHVKLLIAVIVDDVYNKYTKNNLFFYDLLFKSYSCIHLPFFFILFSYSMSLDKNNVYSYSSIILQCTLLDYDDDDVDWKCDTLFSILK